MPPNDPRFVATSPEERELYYITWQHADAAAKGNQYYESDLDEEDLTQGDMATMLAALPTLAQALPPDVPPDILAELGLGPPSVPSPSLPASPSPTPPPTSARAPLPFPLTPPPLFPGEGEPVDPAALFGRGTPAHPAHLASGPEPTSVTPPRALAPSPFIVPPLPPTP
jgi:hypothetical protein